MRRKVLSPRINIMAGVMVATPGGPGSPPSPV
jgi:hypothetical protein